MSAAQFLHHSRKLRSLQSGLDCEHSILVRYFSSSSGFFMVKENGVGKGSGCTTFSKHNQPAKELEPFSVGVNKSYSWTRAFNSHITSAVTSLNGSFLCRKMASARPFSTSAVPELPAHQEIKIQTLSPTVAEGNIAKWLKKEGDKVSPGEVKATMEIECIEDDYLTKIIHGDGAKEIKVGEIIAVTVDESKDQPGPSQPKVEEKVPCFFPLWSSRLFTAESEVPTCIIKPWEDEIFYDDEELGGIHGPIGSDGLPTYVDWRAAGAVCPVQSQGSCGSCWAMSAVAPIEAVNFISTGRLVKLSEQQLIDCNDIQNGGCISGSVRRAYDYIIRTGGLVEAKYYQYTGQRGTCRRMMAPGVQIDSYRVIEYGSERDLKCVVARQPAAVWVNADLAFARCRHGILDGPSYDHGNHYITVVAYNRENDQDYWMAKNSWDTTWGEGGYIRIARGVNRGYGPFGITRLIIYPVKSSGNGMCSVKSDTDMGVRPFSRTGSRTW